MKLSMILKAALATALSAVAFTAFADKPAPMNFEGNPGGVRFLEEGQPPVIIHPTVEGMKNFRDSFANIRKPSHGGGHGGGGGSTNLTYHGGVGGIGVETAPKIYLVLWGSQWNNNDPSGEAATLESFIGSIGGSSWFNSVTQYCQGVASGTTFCNGAGTPAGNQPNMYAGVWADNGSATPNSPSQSQIAAEAVRAAQHFGNTTAASNASVNYIIALPTGVSPTGFKTQYCAYHSSTSASFGGNVAYTNLPYLTDAGASCGANFNGLGPNAGITIVSGHEMAEAASDQFPNGGWLDGSGSENGDKCAWIATGTAGASADVTMNGNTFPVQSLWSNAANNDAGGCVLSY